MFDSQTCFSKITQKPLKSYESQYEAEQQESYVFTRYGNKQVAYLCSKCGFWHLSPKDRQTKGHMSSCTDSNGNFKTAYDTYDDAKRRAEIILEEKGTSLKIYQCSDCGKWHLTHNLSSF